MHLERSILRGLAWVAQAPDQPATWVQVTSAVGAYLDGLFRRGAFQGTTAVQAWLPAATRRRRQEDDLDHGVLNVVVGFAPLRPAEFVIVRISTMTSTRTTPP